MFNLEYEIKMDERGDLYIKLSDDYIDRTEDKFLFFSLTTAILDKIYNNNKNNYNDDFSDDLTKIKTTLSTLMPLTFEMNNLLKNDMRQRGMIELMLNNKYQIKVHTKDDLFNLPIEDILYSNKLFKRENGLKVFVEEEMNIYELKDGIENSNWEIIDNEKE